jgi:hypothetical protein
MGATESISLRSVPPAVAIIGVEAAMHPRTVGAQLSQVVAPDDRPVR